jgi:hypothetical protein
MSIHDDFPGRADGSAGDNNSALILANMHFMQAVVVELIQSGVLDGKIAASNLADFALKAEFSYSGPNWDYYHQLVRVFAGVLKESDRSDNPPTGPTH